MEQKNEGMCRFCLKTFSASAMGRHLSTCKAKKEQDAQELAKAKIKYPIYHINISSNRYYWLHIEMKAAATLRELDNFLRQIWLECCGHLSAFKIKDVEYEDTELHDDWSAFNGTTSESIDTSLVNAMDVGDKFTYEYDFGSTTYVEGKIIAARQGALTEPVRILTRNNTYMFECVECGRQASDYCTDCECFFCEQCLTDIERHECGEEMALPLVNSPRMGVCGYTGDYDFDDFSLPDANRLTDGEP